MGRTRSLREYARTEGISLRLIQEARAVFDKGGVEAVLAMTVRRRGRPALSEDRKAKVIRMALIEPPMSAAQIAEASEVSRDLVLGLVKAARKRQA